MWKGCVSTLSLNAKWIENGLRERAHEPELSRLQISLSCSYPTVSSFTTWDTPPCHHFHHILVTFFIFLSISILLVIKISSCMHWVLCDRWLVLLPSDTGSDPDRLIHFHEVKAHPMPIIVPGTLYVTFAGNFTSDLPRRLTVELNIMKYFFGFPFSVPCLKGGIGSW